MGWDSSKGRQVSCAQTGVPVPVTGVNSESPHLPTTGSQSEKVAAPASGLRFPRIVLLLLLVVTACGVSPADTVLNADRPLIEQLPANLPEYQKEILEDQVVTRAEYDAAHQRWVECVQDKGHWADIYWEDVDQQWTLMVAPAGYEFRPDFDGTVFSEEEWAVSSAAGDECDIEFTTWVRSVGPTRD